jgi:hypothetical protein
VVRLPLLVVVLLAAGAGTAAPREPSQRDVLSRAGEYAVRFGETFATIIGEESYEQQLVLNQRGEALETRRLQSDIAFVRLAGSSEWLTLRSVTSVDGASVAGTGRLERAIRGEAGAYAQARAIADQGARYNLGPLQRNFNSPTLVLQFLHPDHRPRFRFQREGEEELAGERVWVLGFEERGRPTFITSPGGKSLPCRGRIWVVPQDGRVVRTELAIDDFQPVVWVRQQTARGTRSHPVRSRATITVAFRADAGIGHWVPGEMRERYEGAWSAGRIEDERLHYSIVGRATYSNFRRFDVEVRIK